MHVHTTCPPHEVNTNTQQTNMDHCSHIHLLCGMRSHTTTCKVKRGSSAQHTLPVLYLVLCSTEHTPQSTMQTAVHSRQTTTKYYTTHCKHMGWPWMCVWMLQEPHMVRFVNVSNAGLRQMLCLVFETVLEKA